MKLKLLDRAMLPTVLPKEGNLVTIRIVKDIVSKVDLTQKDFVSYDIKPLESGGLTWDNKYNDVTFDIDFTELEVNEIKKALKVLDETNKLNTYLLGLVDIFLT